MDPRTCQNCGDKTCFLPDPTGGHVCCTSCGYIDEAATDRHLTVDYTPSGYAILDPDDLPRSTSGDEKSRAEQVFLKSVKSLIEDWLFTLGKIKLLKADTQCFVEPAMNWYLKIRQAELLDTQKRRTKTLEEKRKRFAEPGPSRRVDYSRSFNAVKIPYHVAIAIRLALQESHLIVLYASIEKSMGTTGDAKAVVERPKGLGQWTEGGGKIPVPSLLELFSAMELPENLACRFTSLPYLRAQYRRFATLLGSHMSTQDTVLCNVIDHVEWMRNVMLLPFDERVALFKTTDTFSDGVTKKARPNKWTEEEFEYFEDLQWDDLLPLAYNLWRAQACVSLWSGVAHRGGSVFNYSIALVCWCITAIRKVPMYKKKGMPPIAQELAALYDATLWSTVAKFNELQKFIICWASNIPELVDSEGQPVPFPSIEIAGTSRSNENEAGDGLHGFKSDRRRKIPDFHIAALVASTIADHWRQIADIRRKRPGVIPFEAEANRVRKLVAQHAVPAPKKRAKLPPGQGKTKKIPGKRAKLDRSSEETVASSEVTTPITVTSPDTSIAPSPTASSSSHPKSMQGQFSPRYESMVIDTATTSYPSPYHLAQRSPPPPPTVFPGPVAARNFWQAPLPESVEELLRRPEDSSDEEAADSDDDETPTANRVRRRKHVEGSVGAGFSIGPKGLEKLNIPINTQVSVQAIQSPPRMRFKPSRRASSAQSSSAPSPTSTVMSRSDSSSSSQSSQTGRSDITAYSGISATTLHSLGSAFPESSRPSRAASVSAESQQTSSAKEYRPKDPYAGCLDRERDQYLIQRAAKTKPPPTKHNNHLHQLMEEWVENQKRIGDIPRDITPAYLAQLGLPHEPVLRDLCLWAARMGSDRGWTPAEAWLRAGRSPSEIPFFHMPTSVTALRADLYRLSDKLQPIGQDLDAEELDEEMKILFEGGDEDDSAEMQILSPEEVIHREWIYATNGTLDKITAASAKATERLIEQEEDAAQRSERDGSESSVKGKAKGKRKRDAVDLGNHMLEGWTENFALEDDDGGDGGDDDGEGGTDTFTWMTGTSLQGLLQMSGEAAISGSASGAKRIKHSGKSSAVRKLANLSSIGHVDSILAGLEAFEEEKDDYEAYWDDDAEEQADKKKKEQNTKKKSSKKAKVSA